VGFFKKKQAGFFGSGFITTTLPITDISKIFKLVFCFIVEYMMYPMSYFFSKTSKITIYEINYFNWSNFNILL